jgi:IS30 family transposase
MTGYTQLTQAQRYQLYAFRKAGWTQSACAHELGCHKSTLSRELRRNRGKRGYRPKQAQEKAQARRQQRVQPRLKAALWDTVATLLRLDWSPQQIHGRLRLEGQPTVSHERIYQYIYADKRRGGDLWTHLRCQKKRRQRYGSGRERRGVIANRRSIDERPAVVAAKTRLGDWEADTIVGAAHQQAIVSVVERKSRLTRLAKVPQNTAEAVQAALTQQLAGFTVNTITSDNGREFARHQEIAAQFGADFYFAHPYHSWERGLNEQTNGLVRQYFPKGSSFKEVTLAAVSQVAERLNQRPRKVLNYQTPNEVYFKQPLIALTT